jgi:broad specificity phosphatase PhoE
VTRLLLVRHGTTAETRRAAFPSSSGVAPVDACPPLDAPGRRDATALGACLPDVDRVWSSHAQRALATARAAGREPGEVLADLAEADFGRWAGLPVADVMASEADALTAWWSAPDEAAPHGGETLGALRERAARVLARAVECAGATLAFTHGGLVKAALLEALGLPSSALWSFDVAPCSVTELSAHERTWRVVRLNWTPSLVRSSAMAP